MRTAERIEAEGMAFMLLPHRYLHDSWRGELMSEPVWRLLAASPRVEGRLAAFVCQRLGLPAVSPRAFGTPQARFCLLPGDSLLRIALFVGLALNSRRVARMIEGKLVARFRHELGVEAYAFATRRAPLITTRTDPRMLDFHAETSVEEQLVQSGVNYFGLALADLGFGLRARLALRLPKTLGRFLESPEGGVAPDASWPVVRKIVREAEPEWNGLLS
jgi:hypothetical protein